MTALKKRLAIALISLTLCMGGAIIFLLENPHVILKWTFSPPRSAGPVLDVPRGRDPFEKLYPYTWYRTRSRYGQRGKVFTLHESLISNIMLCVSPDSRKDVEWAYVGHYHFWVVGKLNGYLYGYLINSY
jgi:hypothetical protein